ncbi:MAG: hypothetical protein HZB46_08710, partial [Solirubrobacterales bacterium]|nr:hypothetical protein [Solirubrobacterales bacterium]
MGHGRWPHFVIGAVLLAALGGCGADEPTPPAAAAALPELRAVVALPDEQVARPLLRSSAVHLWPAGTAAEAAEVLCAGDVELALVVGDVPHCAGDGTLAALPIGRLPGVLGAWGRIGGRCVDRPELRVLLRGAEPPTFRALGWRNDARVRITRPALDDPAWRALARWAGVGRPPARLRAADDTVQRRLAKRHPRAAL